LVVDGMNLGKISVGKPYFETIFLLPMVPLVIAAGVGMHAAWRSADGAGLLRRLRWLAIAAILIGIGFPLVVYGSNSVLTAVGFAAGLWLILSSCRDPIARLLGKGPRITQSMIAMQMAHIGVGLFVIGVTATSSFSIETDQRIVAGETVTVADYVIRMGEVSEVEGPNYTALRAEMEVTRAGKPVAILYPEKRLYRVQQSPMTEADIDDGWGRHLFIALGDQLGQDTWSVRIQYKPLIRLIWFGAFVMALGGLIGITDPRYRLRKVAADIETTPASSVPAS